MREQDVDRASSLLRQRKQVETAKLAHVGYVSADGWGSWRRHFAADEQLLIEIERWRKRRLAEIDEELRTIGVEAK